MEKFILNEKLTREFQLIVPNLRYASKSDIIQAINGFIEDTTKQPGKYVSKDLEITIPSGWNIIVKNNKDYSTITLVKAKANILPLGSDNDIDLD